MASIFKTSMNKINFPKIFKELGKLHESNDEALEIVSAVIERAASSLFDCRAIELQISKNFWGWGWNVYENKTGERLDYREFSERSLKINREQGTQGEIEFQSEYKEIYDYKIYKDHLKRLDQVCKVLNNLGFKTKKIYTKQYQKCTVNKGPESIWLIVK